MHYFIKTTLLVNFCPHSHLCKPLSTASYRNSLREQEALFMFSENTSLLPLEADKRSATESDPWREITGPMETNYTLNCLNVSRNIQQRATCTFFVMRSNQRVFGLIRNDSKLMLQSFQFQRVFMAFFFIHLNI